MDTPSFFQTVHSPYYICASNFTPKVAGIRALYYLCNALNQLGEEAYIVGASEQVPHLRAPLLTVEDVERHRQGQRIPITLYPEVVSGNPLNMPHVARWLLNKAGHIDGTEQFAESEMLFAYNQDYISESAAIPLLSLPVVNNSIFNNRDNPLDKNRQGTCYYAHKYLAKGGQLTEHVKDSVSLCQNVSLSPQQIAQVLRQSECLYCYEPSAIIAEALLCGCPVVMIPSDYLKNNVTGTIHGDGIASDTSEAQWQHALATVGQAQQNYAQFRQQCWEHLNYFVHYTQVISHRREEEFSSKEMSWGDEVIQVLSQNSSDSSIQRRQSHASLETKRWLAHQHVSEGRISSMAEKMITQWQQPSFHLLIVVNPRELEALSETLMSLESQLYSAWGLTILSAMPKPEVFDQVPDNIEWIQITSSLNEEIEGAVAEAGLDWIMQLWPGDKLSPEALLSFVETINQDADFRFIYADEMSDAAQPELLLKPDFNLDLLRSSSYLGRACIIRHDAFDIIGGYTAFAYVYVTDLAFKIYETYGEKVIAHIPDVLFTAASVGIDDSLLLANEISIRQGHFMRLGVAVNLMHPPAKPRFQVQYLSAEPNPPVSIIIAQRNQANALAHCVESLLQVTDYPNFEVILVDADSDMEDMPFLYKELTSLAPNRIKVLRTKHQNYAAAVNEGLSQAATELVVVLSPFTVTPNANWLRQLVNLSAHPLMGLVGCRVIDDKKAIIHAGTVLGVGNDIHGQFHGSSVAEVGYMERAHVIQQYSSVSSACYLVLKNNFLKAGGLDEDLADSGFAVVDLSLKLQQQGLKVLWTPFSTVVQDVSLAASHNGVSDYKAKEASEVMLSRWPKPFRDDPMFHPKLSLRSAEFLVDNQIVFDGNARAKEALRVMAFPLNESGTGRYRCIDPLHQLERQGQIEVIWLPTHEFQTQPFQPNAFEVHRLQPDVVFIQQALSDKHYAYFKQLKARTGLSFVFSLDDLLMSLPDQSNRKSLVFRDMRHRLRRTLALCDRLVVTTPTLAEAYAPYINDIVIIPNSLDLDYWPKTEPKRKHAGKPRVGWAGATQHSGDLSMLTEVVTTLAKDVDWVFMGMCPDQLQSVVKEVHPYVSFSDYPASLASLDLDLAIAPLENNAFNQAKSNLRLLEYGIYGWPVIASNVTPYRENDPPVMLVENTYEAWITAMKAAIADPDNLAANGNELKNWVLDNYNLTQTLPNWMKAISF